MQPHVSDHKQEYNYDNSHVCALTCGVKVHTHAWLCTNTCTCMFCVSQEWLVNAKKHTFYGMKLPTGFQLIGKVVQRFFFLLSFCFCSLPSSCLVLQKNIVLFIHSFIHEVVD